MEDDSHLLKVMRAYHLNKAQTRDELPDWLFDEKERGRFALLRSPDPEKLLVSEAAAAGRPPPVVPPKQSLNNLYSDGSRKRWTRLLGKRWKHGATSNFESLRI